MIERNRLLALIAVLAMALAACGSDDGGEVRNIGDEAEAGSASASASGLGEITPGDGGYDYASDVSAHQLVVEDVCDIKELLDADSIDYGAIETIYVQGDHSVNPDGSVRTLAGFATADDRLHGLDDYYGTEAPLDEFVSAAIAGNGIFAGAGDGVRAQAIEKGTQNQIMVAWVDHELNSALQKASDGDFDPASGAVHNWDEAWAFYYGAAPGCAPYATANSRAGNFGTQGSDGETALANEQILAAMIAGRDALLGEDASGAEAAAEEIRQALFITYSQAAIRYATLTREDVAAGDDETAAEHLAEGLAFWRVIEAWAADAGADVATVNAIFDLGGEPGANGGGDEVRAALEPAWAALDITADDVGELG